MQKKQIDLRLKVDLSIIIINFGNTKEYTKKCLESVMPAVKKISAEVIVIDNISTDGTGDMVKKSYPEVIYIRKDVPHGFGANNNFGLNKTTGRYVLFLNNDVKIINENIFKEMIGWMDKNQKVGVVGPALINSDRKTLQPSGGSFPNLINAICWMIFFNSRYHPKGGYYENEHNQDWVTGAFYLVRKKAIDQAGFFDEDYDAYVEEVDLSYRIKKFGWQIWYLPKWKTVHYGGVSYGNENSIIYELKNIKLFYKKHYPKWQLPILNIIIKMGCLLRIIIFGVVNPKFSKIYAKAFKSV